MPQILIKNGSILTPDGWLESGYMWIEDGNIGEIGAGQPSPTRVGAADEVIDARHCAVLPGLTNAHTHFSQTFMRGLAGGQQLIDWLRDVIWPIQRVISPQDMHLAALLGLVENLHCGAIYVTDHHKVTTSAEHTDAVLKAAREIGLHFTLARSWSDRGKAPESPDRIIDDLSRLYDQTKDDARIQIANGPLALWRCSTQTLQKTYALAQDHRMVTHMHVSESQDEVQMSLEEYGLRPVAWLDSIGILEADTEIVHAVWVETAEIDLIANAHAPVIHCPVSNAVLGSGVAPVAAMLARGVEVRLGTDGPASNDTQDLWETLKMAVSLARATSQNPTVLPPSEALKLGMGGKPLKVGAPADLIIVNLNHPGVVPVQDIDSALVLGTHGSHVRTVIVDGEVLMQDGCVTMLDELALYEECRQAIQALRKRANLLVA